MASQADESADRLMAGRTELITGGTDGIGLHTASGLAAMAGAPTALGRLPTSSPQS